MHLHIHNCNILLQWFKIVIYYLTYAPFELNYGYMPRLGQHITTDTSFRGVKQFAQQALWNLLDVHEY